MGVDDQLADLGHHTFHFGIIGAVQGAASYFFQPIVTDRSRSDNSEIAIRGSVGICHGNTPPGSSERSEVRGVRSERRSKRCCGLSFPATLPLFFSLAVCRFNRWTALVPLYS